MVVFQKEKTMPHLLRHGEKEGRRDKDTQIICGGKEICSLRESCVEEIGTAIVAMQLQGSR